MAKYDHLPDQDDVTRWVKPKLLAANDEGEILTDANGAPLKPFPQAFLLRDGEEDLSLTWVDHFGPHRLDNIKGAAEAHRQTLDSKRLSQSGAFVIARVIAFKNACGRHSSKVRVLEDPVEGNPGHVSVRNYPPGISELHEELASEIFSERYFYRDLQ